MFLNLKKETESLIKGIVQLVYWMRGAISYHDMFWLSPAERDQVRTFVDGRLEDESKLLYRNY